MSERSPAIEHPSSIILHSSSHSSSSISLRPETISSEKPFSGGFFDKNNAVRRGIYLKILFGGTLSIILLIFAVFSIYWGSLWKTPVRNLNGWVVDFDGGLVGQAVAQALTSAQVSQTGKVTWTARPSSQFSNGLDALHEAVMEERTWAIVTIHAGSTARLQASYATPNASYDGSNAITVYAAEARNENAFRSLIKPSAQVALDKIAHTFALQSTSQLTSSPSLATLLSISPQTVVTPISYTFNNLAPFNKPVASAVTFVGLLYQLILAFFIVMMSYSARDTSGLNRSLSLGSLIVTRYASAFGATFVVSLFYALLSLAFQLDFSRKFGHGGFVLFWMANWLGMLSVGLALESVLVLLTTAFIPYFMLLWIIANVAVLNFPIEVMPVVFRYGYAAPFYNVSHAVRCIVFGTKNTVGKNFGVLIAWATISCITLPLIQWFVRRRDIAQANQVSLQAVEEERTDDEKQGA